MAIHISNNDIYKSHVVCQIFPSINEHYFGLVHTPTDTLICYANSIGELKRSLGLAVQEVCDFIEGRVSEDDFITSRNERESIMRGILSNNGISTDTNDLYYTLWEYFGKTIESYRPFEDIIIDTEEEEEWLIQSLSDIIKEIRDRNERPA